MSVVASSIKQNTAKVNSANSANTEDTLTVRARIAFPARIANTPSINTAAVLQAFLPTLVLGVAIFSVPSVIARAPFRLFRVVSGGVLLGVAHPVGQALTRTHLFFAMETTPEPFALALVVHTLAVVTAVVMASDFCAAETSVRGGAFAHSFPV